MQDQSHCNVTSLKIIELSVQTDARHILLPVITSLKSLFKLTKDFALEI